MTLQRLNEHLNMLLQLQEAKEALGSMKAQILGAVNYDGMPHGHEVSRNTENLSILLSAQIADVNRLEAMVEQSEIEVRQFIDAIEDNRTRLIFSLRFLCGYKWEGVAKMIGAGNSGEATRMVAYRYLQKENCFELNGRVCRHAES